MGINERWLQVETLEKGKEVVLSGSGVIYAQLPSGPGAAALSLVEDVAQSSVFNRPVHVRNEGELFLKKDYTHFGETCICFRSLKTTRHVFVCENWAFGKHRSYLHLVAV